MCLFGGCDVVSPPSPVPPPFSVRRPAPPREQASGRTLHPRPASGVPAFAPPRIELDLGTRKNKTLPPSLSLCAPQLLHLD